MSVCVCKPMCMYVRIFEATSKTAYRLTYSPEPGTRYTAVSLDFSVTKGGEMILSSSCLDILTDSQSCMVQCCAFSSALLVSLKDDPRRGELRYCHLVWQTDDGRPSSLPRGMYPQLPYPRAAQSCGALGTPVGDMGRRAAHKRKDVHQ